MEDTDDFLPEEESEEMREVIEVKTDGLECIQPDLDVASRLWNIGSERKGKCTENTLVNGQVR